MAKCCKKCFVKYKIIRSLLIKLKDIVFLTAIIRIILSSFVPIIVSSGAGRNFGDHPDSKVNLLQIAYIVAVVCLSINFVTLIDAKEFAAKDFRTKWKIIY